MRSCSTWKSWRLVPLPAGLWASHRRRVLIRLVWALRRMAVGVCLRWALQHTVAHIRIMTRVITWYNGTWQDVSRIAVVGLEVLLFEPRISSRGAKTYASAIVCISFNPVLLQQYIYICYPVTTLSILGFLALTAAPWGYPANLQEKAMLAWYANETPVSAVHHVLN